MKIREDLLGVVTVVNSETGVVTILKAGDEVPDGVTVGGHVAAATPEPDSETEAEVTEGDEQPDPKPRGRTKS